jgi:hypothetical protein
MRNAQKSRAKKGNADAENPRAKSPAETRSARVRKIKSGAENELVLSCAELSGEGSRRQRGGTEEGEGDGEGGGTRRRKNSRRWEILTGSRVNAYPDGSRPPPLLTSPLFASPVGLHSSSSAGFPSIHPPTHPPTHPCRASARRPLPVYLCSHFLSLSAVASLSSSSFSSSSSSVRGRSRSSSTTR